MYFPIFPRISSFSSNRKARNSVPSFQFMTPGQRTHSKICETHEIPAFPGFRMKQNLDHTHFIHDPGPAIWQNQNRKTQTSSLPENALNDPIQKSMKFRTQRKYFSILLYSLHPTAYIKSIYASLASSRTILLMFEKMHPMTLYKQNKPIQTKTN